MISVEAQRAIERLRAEQSEEDVPLAQARHNWEMGARELPLPPGAQFSPVVTNGIAGEWMDTPGMEPGRVMLLLHGGGYNAGSPVTHRRLAAFLGEACGLRVLTPDYRLAPEHAFPAAVDDALAAWRWLVGPGGYAAPDVIVAGDSAGGGLALSMMLRLREAGEPQPRAAILLSPWTDLTCSSPSYAALRERDPSITEEGLRRAGLWYAGTGDPANPMASPLFADLSGLPPLLIHVGGEEVMLDDSRLFGERAVAAGVPTVCKVWPGLWHVFHHDADDVPEARDAIEEIGAYVAAQLDDPRA